MMKTDIREDYSASIKTPFLNTTEKCLRFFYRSLGGSNDIIRVTATNEDLFTKTVFMLSPTHDYWQVAYVSLLDNVHIVAIEGHRGKGISGMAIDDIEIAKCSNFEGRPNLINKYRNLVIFFRYHSTAVLGISARY